MSRLELPTPSKAQLVVEGLYKDLERRIEASPPGLCLLISPEHFWNCAMHRHAGSVYHAVSDFSVEALITDVLNGEATMETLDLMERTARSIMETADCAIGYEAARMVYKGLIGYREDYEEHIRNGRCTCTYNQPVPCVALCPAHVDIPGYIALVREERYADAIRLIRKDNPFPTTCGFICEHPCEARCRRNMVDDAVNIRGLKRMAADFAGKVPPRSALLPPARPLPSSGESWRAEVPHIISSSWDIRLQYTRCCPELGGMLRYGIPNYRLPKDRLGEDIQAILDTGVQVKHGLRIGTDVTVQELRASYDAVLITIGASTDKKLGIEGEDAEGVMSAVRFLRDVGRASIRIWQVRKLPSWAAGNVSMDAVRSAVRLGAKKVSILYRRRTADMTALPAELRVRLPRRRDPHPSRAVTH